MSNASLRLARLETRSRLLQALRRFFVGRSYVEVETPVRIETPALESHIDAEPCGEAYLRTSPELHMKRLVCEGMERIFQIGPCFRRGEFGRLHRPEYTMLEWYCAGAGYLDAVAETRDLMRAICQEMLGAERFIHDGRTVNVGGDWALFDVAETFVRTAGWNPAERFDADRFDMDWVAKVEPALPVDVPVVLMDFPAEAAALARCRPGPPPVAERWELYVAGVELANAFGELTDATEQRRRFEVAAAQRAARGQPVYPLDEAFLAALEKGMPDCAGVALGVDRLAMLLAGADSIGAVRAF